MLWCWGHLGACASWTLNYFNLECLLRKLNTIYPLKVPFTHLAVWRGQWWRPGRGRHARDGFRRTSAQHPQDTSCRRTQWRPRPSWWGPCGNTCTPSLVIHPRTCGCQTGHSITPNEVIFYWYPAIWLAKSSQTGTHLRWLTIVWKLTSNQILALEISNCLKVISQSDSRFRDFPLFESSHPIRF